MEAIFRIALGAGTVYLTVTGFQEGFPGVSTPVEAAVLASFLGMTAFLAVFPGKLGK